MTHKQITPEDLQALPPMEWEGYLWYDDQEQPEVYTTGTVLDFAEKLSTIPFIVEGYLYAKNTKTSLYFAHYNGDYHLYRITDVHYDPATIQQHYCSQEKFPPKIKGLQFVPVYEDQEDVSDTVLQIPRFLYPIFIGFSL